MFDAFARKIFGSANDRLLKKYQKKVQAINALEPKFLKMTDSELKTQTNEFRQRLKAGETLDDLLPEAFAVVREAAKRVLGMRPFDVQLIGGIVLHEGKISEMRTGEGKTLVTTLPCYLNALTGDGVHVVTVNDYLVERDSAWMGAVHEFLGLTVSCIIHDLDDDERKRAYASDIVYATNHELGFDYLRDNMKFRLEDRVLRKLNYAIVDEVDSILVDEARTPLIISGPAEDSSDLYISVNKVMHHVKPEDYEKDEKRKSVTLTEIGTGNLEKYLKEAGLIKSGSLYDLENTILVHHCNQALRAHTLFQLDTDYIVQNSEVKLIDEFTGRVMEGRRFSDGLHQALEAKEGVPVQLENQTLASITYQNFFRLYKKLSGMTGTAATEAAEFEEIYNLQTIIVPTNVPIARQDHEDEIYRTLEEKDQAILELIKKCHEKKQPVLVGTTSIEKSELLAKKLKKNKIPHEVLNARFHDKEAQIVAEAGSPGAITISTNMAGRGTDIKLGGNIDSRLKLALEKEPNEEKLKKITQELIDQHKKDEETVRKSGGLYVIGTERHESRRIDNQLRGRSGRQGDPGSSKFFLSLEDDLMRIFGSEKLDTMLKRLGLKQGEAITHPWISKALEKAQKRVEARNFDIRKHLLKYDDVMNSQRKAIYGQRLEVMQENDISETIHNLIDTTIDSIVHNGIPKGAYPENWDIESIHMSCRETFGIDFPVKDWAKEDGIAEEEIKSRIYNAVYALIKKKEEEYGSDIIRVAERTLFLRILDQLWKDHLLSMDHMRESINLRAYAQRDPLNEYKHEAFTLFELMLDNLKTDIVRSLCHLELNNPTEESVSIKKEEGSPGKSSRNLFSGNGYQEKNSSLSKAPSAIDPQSPETWTKSRRNAPCPCGSGKKYKQCHGAVS